MVPDLRFPWALSGTPFTAILNLRCSCESAQRVFSHLSVRRAQVTRVPAGFLDLRRLPDSFGGAAYRGTSEEGTPVVVLVLPLGADPGTRAEAYGVLARRWEALGVGASVLLRLVRWAPEGPDFVFVFQDPGGPLASDALDDPEVSWTGTVPEFLDQWERLTDRGATWSVLDPQRIIVGPRGVQSFDPVHLIPCEGDTGLPFKPFTTPSDLRVLSPEMTQRTSWPVDHRSGFFSLGALIYRQVSGTWPLETGDPLAMVHQLLNQTPNLNLPSLSAAGPGLQAILARLLQKDPRDRYQTLRGLKWDLGARNRSESGPFVPGTRDRPRPLADLRMTHGRDREATVLGAVLERLAGGLSSALLVRGGEGMGKSRLVHDLRDRAERTGWLWLSADLSPEEGKTPSLALTEALDAGLAVAARKSHGDRQRLATAVQLTLGTRIPQARGVLPSLASLMTERPGAEPSRPEGRQVWTHGSLVGLFRVVAEFRPLVLAVENLHRADDRSLALVEALVRDRAPGLALVATCRPGEAAGADGLEPAFREGPGPDPRVLDLGPLDDQAVAAIVDEVSDLDDQDRAHLTRFLIRHGGGVPYVLKFLLQEMNFRKVVDWDEAAGRWHLRPGRLRNLPVTGIKDLLGSRLATLGPDHRRALVASALLGVSFSRAEVLAAVSLDRGRFDALAEELIDLGVWERAGSRDYRFSHDGILQAVVDWGSPEDRDEARLRIGLDRLDRWRRLREPGPGAVAVFLNPHKDRLPERDLQDLFDLNVLAGDDARRAGDFRSALEFSIGALSLGGDGLWERNPQEAWMLHKTAAEAAYAERRRDLADLWCEQAVVRAGDPVLRAQIREMQQTMLYYLGDTEASLRAGFDGLACLNIPITPEPGPLALLGVLAQVKICLGTRAPWSLRLLPENTDFSNRLALRLFTGFIPPAFLSGRRNLFGLAVLKGLLLAVRNGLSAEAAPVFTGYALILSGLGQHRRAREWGTLAVEVNRRFEDLTWRPMVLTLTGLFCTGWFEPWDRLKPRFEAARRASEEGGDLLYRTYDDLFITLWNPGEDLPARIKSTEAALTQILADGYPLTRTLAWIVLGSLRSLAGTTGSGDSWPAPGVAPGAAWEEILRLGSLSAAAACHSQILQSSFVLGDLTVAHREMEEAWTLRSSLAGSLYEEALVLYSGLTCAELVRRGTPRYARRLARCRSQARGWARDSATFAPHADLLEAEEGELLGRVFPAQRAFLSAIEAADRSGHLVLRALTRERAAGFFFRHGMAGPARHHRNEALDLWKRYGAWAKVERLEAEAGLLAPRTGTPRSSDPELNVDLETLVRALDAISVEIGLEPLVDVVTKLILENSGADGLAFFIPRSGQLVLLGEWGISSGPSRVGQVLDSLENLPRTLLRQAFREARPLVFPDLEASVIPPDPVLKARGVRSVVCLPLVSRGDAKALVYLENRVSAGILTPDRIRILELLSSTIGMAVQNAQLFQDVRAANEGLERWVEERTSELKASRKKILLQEKMASLGALTAGIAHELKNPLNLVTNFSESSLELMGDLVKVLTPHLGQLPPEVKAEVDYLLPELVQNMEDLRVQGERGDAIIRSMLLHSRSDSGDQVLDNLATLIRESLSLAYHGMRATQKDFHCRIREVYDPKVPLVPMIRSNLGRVFLNLFTNAFQAVLEKQRTGGGDYQPEVSVTTSWAGKDVLVVVEDNGPGIPEDLQEKVFQPFFTTKSPGEGTGLGLSLSYEIVREEMGGSLGVESRPGGPTRFLIHLPAPGESPP
jgi:signal transduction histidine kinase/predicted ATPase